MASYYIYLPVNDLQLVKIAEDWKRDSKKDIEVIVRTSQGFKKAMSRAVFGGVLKNVSPGSTVYVLAHGFSAGKQINGPEAAARSILSTYGSSYSWIKKQFPDACKEFEQQGYANLNDGADALQAALDDDASYAEVVQILSKYSPGSSTTGLTIDQPGAIKIGGTRPDNSSKIYSPAEFAQNLIKEGLPQVARLKIFACNSGITPPNQTACFAEQLYGHLRANCPNIRVFGYLGATKANYGPQKATNKDGEIPANASEIWSQFHLSGGGTYAKKQGKGVRMIEPKFQKVVIWGNTNAEFVPAHILRVEFPGGQSVIGDMKVQEDESKPF